VEESKVRKCVDAEATRENFEFDDKNAHLKKTHHAGPAWIRSASFSVLLREASWSRNSCHNAFSAWASLKWAGGPASGALR
jgi:hypothetical protein